VRPTLSPDRQATYLLVACGLFLAAVLGAVGFVTSLQDQAEKNSEVDRPNANELVVLVDRSDPPSQDQAAQLDGWLQQLAEETLNPGDVLTVWTLGQSSEGPLHRVLRLHRPPRTSNPLYQNRRQTLDRYDARFARPLRALMARLPAGPSSRWSPILEAISTLAELPDLQGSGRRRLVLVSDLAQHSAAASFLSEQPSFRTFEQSRIGAGMRPNLHGVVVNVLVLPRAGQGLEVEIARRRFWRTFFLSCGAASAEVERL
jgi:hypothetical protein